MSSPVALLGILILVGVVGRIVVAYATYGVEYDIVSFELVGTALANDPLQVYSATEGAEGRLPRWPYLPGFFPWIHLSGILESKLGLPAHGTYQLPQILADAAIAVLVFSFLGRRGASDRTRLLAATVVIVGPSFAATSGYHGHIDSLAILPAVAALVLWERPTPRRWIGAGALIGVGTAIKTVPILMLLALLPRAKSRSEALRTAGLAFAVPALTLVPFLAADGFDALPIGRSAAVGLGGLSLVVQPGLADLWLTAGSPPSVSQLNQWLYDANTLIALGTVACLAAFLFRYRPPPLQGAVLVWLALYVLSPALFIHYLVWGMPFFLMAGYLRQAVVLQAVVVVPTIIAYAGRWPDETAARLYAAVMIALWVWAAVALVVLATKIVRGGSTEVRRLAGPSYEGSGATG